MENLNFSRFLMPAIIFTVCCGLLILLMVLKKKVIKKHGVSDILVSNARAPIQIFIGLTVLYVFFEVLKSRWTFNIVIQSSYSILATLCLGWLAIKVINLISSLLLHYFDLQQENNYRARQVHTEIRVFKSLAVAFIVFFCNCRNFAHV